MKITPAYLEEQRRLHASPRGYGGRGSKWAPDVTRIARAAGVHSILDYGAGQGTLGAALREKGFKVQDFDPAVDAFAAPPREADLVTCTDVLEHVEGRFVEAVLDELRDLGPLVFVVISLVPTAKTLSDGRQAHITLKPRQWWLDMIDMALVEEIENQPAKQFVGLFRRKA